MLLNSQTQTEAIACPRTVLNGAICHHKTQCSCWMLHRFGYIHEGSIMSISWVYFRPHGPPRLQMLQTNCPTNCAHLTT